MPALSIRWSPFPWICYAMCVGVMGTALASPLYPIYQSVWGLRTSTLTLLFVVYMVGALASLLFVGRITLRFGFLGVLRTGLITMTLGVGLSLLATHPVAFGASRVLIGLASGMVTTASAIGLVRVSRSTNPQRTSAIITVLMTLGFGSGPLLGGLVAQFAPWPLRSPYVPTLLMCTLACVALFKVRAVPRHRPEPELLNAGWSLWVPRLSLPPQVAMRPFFWLAAACAFCTFGMFSLYASLAPSFMKRFVPWSGPLVSGASIAIILFLSAAVQLSARRLNPRRVGLTGLVLMVLSNALLLATNVTAHATLYVLTVLLTATSHGMVNLCCMSLITGITSDQERPTILASYLVIGYLGSIVPILGVGWLADHVGLTSAINTFTMAMAALCAWLAWRAWQLKAFPMPDN